MQNYCYRTIWNRHYEILKGYFRDANNNYSGQYKEEFELGQDTGDFVINGNWGTNWGFNARGDNSEDSAGNHADIQIYWYGNCDMWIDYVRVDNDIADRLFVQGGDPEFEKWLRWEARDIVCYSNGTASYNFYLELFEFNNIPCMSYVMHKLDSLTYSYCNKHVSLLCIPIPFWYSGHVPWSDRLRVMNAGHFARNFVEKVGVKEFLLGYYPFNSEYHYPESYPYNTWSKIPNTLDSFNRTGTLANPVSPAAYDDWLQISLDSIPYSFESGFNSSPRNPVEQDQGGFRYTMKWGDSVSKLTGVPFIYNPQVHLWFRGVSDPIDLNMGAIPREITGEVQREPTIEELDLTTNLAICYGVKGLISFQYVSDRNDIGDVFYNRGIMNPASDWSNSTPRYNNIYGQKKWNKIKSISSRIKDWEPYIMSFDNQHRRSYIYRISDERNEMSSSKFIKELQAFPAREFAPDPVPDFTGLTAETNSGAYL